MRVLLITFLFLITSIGFAQVPDYMEHNNTRVTLPTLGKFFNDDLNALPGFEVPKNSGNHTMYEARFYFMGLDANDTLHAAWGGGGTGVGNDFMSGPYSTFNNYDTVYQNTWMDRTVQICQEEIDMYSLWWEACNSPNPPIPCVQAPVPSNDLLTRIYDWPAHGNTANGEAYELAPYFDHPASTQGVYDPGNGDYPIIKGCCATYRIDHDDRVHTFSGGKKLGIETHYQTFQYRNWGLLNNVTFIEITVYNRGNTVYPEFAYGMYLDSQLGDFSDDYIGSDSIRSMYFTYNADNNDVQYGVDPPAFGVVALEDSLTSVVSFANFNTLAEVWNGMNGLMPNGMPIMDNQGNISSFEYNVNPNVTGGWSEVEVQNAPSDRRAIIATKHGVFAPGDSFKQTYAFVYANDGDHLQSVDSLYAAADEIHAFYDTITNAQCEGGVLSALSLSEPLGVQLFPNPASGYVHVTLDTPGEMEATMRDMSGKVIVAENGSGTITFDLTGVANGAYFVQIQSGGDIATKKLIVDR
ncbi:MAG: T9SS type A sorting domain-containing protein [Fluviicola sp.]